MYSETSSDSRSEIPEIQQNTVSTQTEPALTPQKEEEEDRFETPKAESKKPNISKTELKVPKTEIKRNLRSRK